MASIVTKLFLFRTGIDMVIALCPFLIATVTSVGFVVYSIIILPCRVVQVLKKTVTVEECRLQSSSLREHPSDSTVAFACLRH